MLSLLRAGMMQVYLETGSFRPSAHNAYFLKS